MAVNLTIGSGGDFANPYDALNWIKNQTPDEYIINLISNIVYSGYNYVAITIPLNFIIRFTCVHNLNLLSDKSQWYSITNSHSSCIFTDGVSDDDELIMYHLQIEYIKFINASSTFSCIYSSHTGTLTRINDCVFTGNGYGITFRLYGKENWKVFNCLFIDLLQSCINYIFGTQLDYIGYIRKFIYNCVIDRCGNNTTGTCISISGNSGKDSIYIQVRNISITNNNGLNPNTYSFISSYPNISDIDYCGCDDNSLSLFSGTHNINNVNSDNEFISLDINNENCCKPLALSDSQLWNNGSDPTDILNYDCAGILYTNVFPIGAYIIIVSENKIKILNIPTIGFRHESIPYQPENLTSNDYHYSINSDIKINPEIENYIQKVLTGNFSKLPSIAGKRLCGLNFSIDLYTMTDTTIAPSYFDILESCGWKKLLIENGIEIYPDSFCNRIPATIEICFPEETEEPRQIVYKISGAMGNVKFSGETGKPIKAEFSFLGCLESLTTRENINIISTNNFDDSSPVSLQNGTFLLFGKSISLNSFEINSSEILNLFSNIQNKHGYDGTRITDHFSSGNIEIFNGTELPVEMFDLIKQNYKFDFYLKNNNLHILSENINISSIDNESNKYNIEFSDGLIIKQQ